MHFMVILYTKDIQKAFSSSVSSFEQRLFSLSLLFVHEPKGMWRHRPVPTFIWEIFLNSCLHVEGNLTFISNFKFACRANCGDGFNKHSTLYNDQKLLGSLDKLHKSNIAINTLTFDMSPFRGLQFLELNNVDLRRMRGFEHIKATVTQLTVHHSLKNLKNLMLGDLFAVGDGDWVHGENPIPTLPWDQIKIANFSNNFLHLIDQTIALLPNVEILNLSNNLLTEIASLTSLPLLRVLYLSDNQLYIGEESNFVHNEGCELLPPDATDLPEGLALSKTSISAGTSESSTERWKRAVPLKPLRERLGEVQILVLANNGLRSASIVDGMCSLQHLDLSGNKIDSFAELTYLGNLPHLNSLELMGNPICDHPYYRRNVLDLLGPRFSLIVPDGQRVTTSESENVRLYRALKKGGAVVEGASPATAPVGHKSSALVDKTPPLSSNQPKDCTNTTSAAVAEGALLSSLQPNQVDGSNVASWSENTPSKTAIIDNHAIQSSCLPPQHKPVPHSNLNTGEAESECTKHHDSDERTALEQMPTHALPTTPSAECLFTEVSCGATQPKTTQLDVLPNHAEGDSHLEHQVSDEVVDSTLVTSAMIEEEPEFQFASRTPPATKRDSALGEPPFTQSDKPANDDRTEMPINFVEATPDENPEGASSVACHTEERRETAVTEESPVSHDDKSGASSTHLKTSCDIQLCFDPNASAISSGLLRHPEATGGEGFSVESAPDLGDAQQTAHLNTTGDEV
uniref:PX domain-containing protein n=1 Tax=Mesocestoides corti TaxID=53468 RepID=A0A5K3EJB2_MESCO